MPPGYTSSQKAAISQFVSFTQADRNTAVRHLKSHNWNQEAAVNGYFSSGGASAISSGAKASISKIFDKYRENATVSPDTIAVEGCMNYFADIGVDIEGLDFLAASEVIQAPAMGEISREGFVDGWSALNCDTLDKQKAYIRSLKASLPTSKEAFSKVYKYTFQLAKTGNQKAVGLDVATTYWDLLFKSPLSAVQWSTSTTPWIDWWNEFLVTAWKKSVNKDVWNETLKFANMSLADEAMSFWTEESSWPSVIDEFVEWVKVEKRGGGQVEVMEE